MTIASAHLVDAAVSRWFRCVTQCVRGAFVLWDEHQPCWVRRAESCKARRVRSDADS
jgi:hypothetical protein